MIETANNPSTGIRLHVHEHEDETWLILGEEYMFFQVGDRTFQAHPGDHVFGHGVCPIDMRIAALQLRGHSSW